MIDVSTSADDTRRSTLARVQLALNVTDLDEAVEFYTKLFGAGAGQASARVRQLRHHRAAVEARPDRGQGSTRDPQPPRRRGGLHREVAAARPGSPNEGLATAVEEEVACCYAVQDEVWVDGPDAEPWEIYTVLSDVRRRPASFGRRARVRRELLRDLTGAEVQRYAVRCC